MVVALIMGRKGSKGFPGKNLYEIEGKPLAYYPMKAAIDCRDVDKIYISTDDKRLKDMAEKLGIYIIERPQELCTDDALGEHVYEHAYNYVKEKNRGEDIEAIALLMCNAPMVTPATISKGIKVLKENPEYDSVVTVSRYNMWAPLRARKIGEDGLLHPFVPIETFGDSENMSCDRDSQGDVWFADMGISIIKPRCLESLEKGLLPQKWMGQKIYPLCQWGGVDVDYEWQIPQVKFWLNNKGNNYE